MREKELEIKSLKVEIDGYKSRVQTMDDQFSELSTEVQDDLKKRKDREFELKTELKAT